jgi:chromosome segregation ATPase
MTDELERRVDELEAKWDEHDKEHLNLRVNLEAIIRSKVESDIAAAKRHIEDIVGAKGPLRTELTKQGEELHSLYEETKAQTPLLQKLRREQRHAKTERIARKAIEEKERADAKKAQELFEKRRNQILLAVGILTALAGAYATLKG